MGRWSMEAGATSPAVCQECPAGRWSDKVGAKSEASCTSCGHGLWSNRSGLTTRNSCYRCPAGRWSNLRVAAFEDNCTACSPGRFGVTEGASSLRACSECQKGRYNGLAGQTECKPRAVVHYAGEAFLAPNGSMHPGRPGSVGDFLSLEKGAKRPLGVEMEPEGGGLDMGGTPHGRLGGGLAGANDIADTVAEFPPGSGPTSPSANLLRSRGVVIEVHNLTYEALSPEQRDRLAHKFADDLAMACHLDVIWVTDPAGRPHTTYLAPSTDDFTTTFVSAELHVPKDTTDVARGCAMIAAGHFGITISEYFGGEAPPTLTPEIIIVNPTTTPGLVFETTTKLNASAFSGRLPNVQAETTSGPSPEEMAAMMRATTTEGLCTNESTNTSNCSCDGSNASVCNGTGAGAGDMGLRAGLLASFLVGMGTICVCCGSFLACLSSPKKRGVVCGMCENEESNSDMEDTEMMEAGNVKAEAAPLLGVDQPSPPMSPVTPKPNVYANGTPQASDRSDQAYPYLTGLDAPSGLTVGSLGLGLPMGTAVYGGQGIPTTQSFRAVPSGPSFGPAIAGPPSPMTSVQVLPEMQLEMQLAGQAPHRNESVESEDGHRKRVVRYELKSLSSPALERRGVLASCTTLDDHGA